MAYPAGPAPAMPDCFAGLPRLDRSRCAGCAGPCVDACPTGAIPEPWFVDANRCISYLTIEHRGPVPRELHAGIGDWVFGCDVCQEVCPWNRRVDPVAEPAFAARAELEQLTLAELARLDEAGFRERFRGTPLARPKRAGLVRNALIAGANAGDAEVIEAARHLVDDPDPTVRETARAVLSRGDR